MMTSSRNLWHFFRSTITIASVFVLFFFFTSAKVNAQSYMKLCTSGISLENAGSLDEAIAKYTSAITLKPDVWNAYSYRAKVYYRKGKYDNAITDISKAIELSPKKLFLYHVRANCYLAKDEYAKAIPDYNMVLLKPKSSDKQLYQTYLYRGDAYYFNNQYSEAITDFTKSMQLSIKQNITIPVYVYYNRALCYYELKKYTEAIAEFDYIITASPTYSYAIFYQGLCYIKTGETAKAKANALKLIEIDPSKEVYFSGEHLLDLFDMDARRKIVNQSLELAKKDIKEYKSNTSSTIGTIKLTEAFAQLDKAWFYSSRIEKDDRDLNDTILERIGYVYSQMKEKPELPELARKYLVQANAATENKKYSDAIASLNKAISIAPYYPLAYYNRSLVYELYASYDGAIADMKKYIELDPAATNVRSAQDKIYEWEGNTKSTGSYVFYSADGKKTAQSNTEANMNSMAIDIENVIGNKIETDNKATQGFFIGYGLSVPRSNFGLVPKVPLTPFSPSDTTAWKDAIFKNGKIGAQSGFYVEMGIALDMEQKAKVRFHYNPFVFCYAQNKINWNSRNDSPVFSESNSVSDSVKSYRSFEMAQRYGISYAPIPKLVAAFYYRIGVSFPFTNIALNYRSNDAAFSFSGENKSIMPFSHTLGFSVSYSFITFSYEWFSTKTKYEITAKYKESSSSPEQEITFNGKLPVKTNRIGISIHF